MRYMRLGAKFNPPFELDFQPGPLLHHFCNLKEILDDDDLIAHHFGSRDAYYFHIKLLCDVAIHSQDPGLVRHIYGFLGQDGRGIRPFQLRFLLKAAGASPFDYPPCQVRDFGWKSAKIYKIEWGKGAKQHPASLIERWEAEKEVVRSAVKAFLEEVNICFPQTDKFKFQCFSHCSNPRFHIIVYFADLPTERAPLGRGALRYRGGSAEQGAPSETPRPRGANRGRPPHEGMDPRV